MRSASRVRVLRRSAWVTIALCVPAAASAQDADGSESGDEIVVVGDRRSAVTGVDPLLTLDVGAIDATGASSMPELLRSIRGATTAPDGSEPIFLLNGQRVSGYQDIGGLPPEAIEKVEVLPEQAALRFGYPPNRRVVNFITKRNFRLIELRSSAGTTTRLASTTEKANIGVTRLRGDGRLTLGLELRHTDAVHQSDREIVPDPDIPYDAIGNIVGLNGEIDPALSSAAGHIVRIAPVPLSDPSSLAAYVPGADRPRAFDLSPYRTLAPNNDALKAEGVFANRIGKALAGSISLSAEQSRDRSLAGPSSASLLIPGGNPYSPFAGPVVLDRFLTEAPVLRERKTTTTLHAGFLLRGAVAGWRWDVTAALDQKQVDGRDERRIDTTAANAAIAAGANPFMPIDAALLANRLTDVSRQRTRTAGMKAVATNAPIRLPAGKVTVTATAEVERAAADSSNRGTINSTLSLGRSRVEGGVSADIPLASRREDFLPFLGELSANASFIARRVSGFGALQESTFGLSWAPLGGIQLLGSIRRSAAAPDMEQQSAPVVRVTDASILDYTTGRSELVTLTLGGNPDLLATRRLTRGLTLNVKPLAKTELRVAITYEATTIRNQTGNVYATTAQTQAILPDRFTRDASGRLIAADFRPTNFALETQRTINIVLNANGQIGKAPPPPKPGAPAGPRNGQVGYYGGIGPTIKISDRLQLRPGTPYFDLLAGDSVNGGGTPRAQGYFYGGLYYMGNGVNFSGWYGGNSRVRNADPAADLRFSPYFKLDLGGYLSIHHFLPHQQWTKKLQMRVDVSNLFDARQRVRDGNGGTPNRFQRDYLDPIGRTLTLSLRKLF